MIDREPIDVPIAERCLRPYRPRKGRRQGAGEFPRASKHNHRCARVWLTLKLSCERSAQYATRQPGCTSISIGGNRDDFR